MNFLLYSRSDFVGHVTKMEREKVIFMEEMQRLWTEILVPVSSVD